MEAISTWLCPTEFDRARVLDNSTRVRRARRVAAAAIGVALIALLPWFGIWILGLFAASAVNLLTLDRRMARSKHPELVVASSLLFTELLLAGGVVLSGAGQSPALPWMAVPVGLTAARFRRRVMVTGAAIGLVLMALATVAVRREQRFAAYLCDRGGGAHGERGRDRRRPSIGRAELPH